MDNRLRKIENALISMGIEPSMRGFYYIVELTVGKIINPTKKLQDMYDEIASEHGITGGSVHKVVTRTVGLADSRTPTYKKYIGSEFQNEQRFCFLTGIQHQKGAGR